MFSWLQQVVTVLFSLRTIPQRLGSACTAALGIAGVVGVLVSVLAISEGFRKTMTATGTPEVAVVLRATADSELTSGVSREEARLIRDAAERGGVAHGTAGLLISSELFVMIDLPKRSTGTSANVPMRGVDQTAAAIRGKVQMVQGRPPEPGRTEVMAGIGAVREFSGLELGSSYRSAGTDWKVVGLFSSGGGVAESEVWTDAAVLQPIFQRGESFQSVYVRLNSADDFQRFKDALTSNPQLKVKVMRLDEFYLEQSKLATDFISTIGIGIAVLMAVGALFGALNTMYSAVAARTREIATLRALGFGAGPVVMSVLAESIVLAFAGGVLGAALAYFVFDGYTAATMNFQTFTQLTFAFAVTPQLLAQAILWAAVLGLFGGVFPAIRAARIPIASGLREP